MISILGDGIFLSRASARERYVNFAHTHKAVVNVLIPAKIST